MKSTYWWSNPDKKANRMLRERARLIGEYNEMRRLLSLPDVKATGLRALVNHKGAISEIEEKLRQNGYSWEVGHEPK